MNPQAKELLKEAVTQRDACGKLGLPYQQRYVAGFLFSKDLTEVAMVHKLRPPWQKDRLNGIGGKVEDSETHEQAMVREFQEETGAYVPAHCWKRFCMLEFPDAIVHFFVAVQGDVAGVEWNLSNQTDEQIVWTNLRNITGGWVNCIDNIPQLVELALQYIRFTRTHTHA